jgi:polar amino acid transport system ATP-binding protein
MSLVSLQNVHLSYGEKPVLRGIDLELEEHDVACLIGPSGCGKSSLLRCVNRLETIAEGEIYVQGDEVSGPGVDVDRLRRQVGIVFQSFNLFPHMSVLKNVSIAPRKILGMRKAEAEERGRDLLTRFGLADHMEQYPDRLSGGQQQRVAIVRALAMGPKVLLLDEVTSALDPELVNEVLAAIKALAAEGMTMIIATHELAFARSVATQVCFILEGVVHEHGPPQQVLGQPRSERTRTFTQRLAHDL